MSFEVQVRVEVQRFLVGLDPKSRRIIKANLEKLEEDPYPGHGRGDKERLPVKGDIRFRIHIGRTWTAFYSIVGRNVRVTEILPIDEAHKAYGL